MIRRMMLLFLLSIMLASCSTADDDPATAVPGAMKPTASEATAPAPTATEIPPTLTETAVPAEVMTVEDVLYATAVDPDAETRKPVVLYAHGSDQSKGSGRIFGRLLAREGYVVLAIDWRDDVTSNREPATMREAMENSLCALRAAADQGDLYGADPQQVIWTGFSAGAWIGSMISLAEGDLEDVLDTYAAAHDGPAQRVACTSASPPAQITAFVPSSGAYPGDYWLGNGVNPEWTAVFAPVRAYSALGHNPGLKVRLIHGAQDFSYETRFKDAESFAEALETAGYDAALLPQKGSHEAFQQAIIDTIVELEAVNSEQ